MMTTGDVGAAMAAVAVIAGAAASGAMLAHIFPLSSHALDPPAEAVAEAPYRGLPFVFREDHLTDWQGLSGGYSWGAKKVKTIVIPAPKGGG